MLFESVFFFSFFLSLLLLFFYFLLFFSPLLSSLPPPLLFLLFFPSLSLIFFLITHRFLINGPHQNHLRTSGNKCYSSLTRPQKYYFKMSAFFDGTGSSRKKVYMGGVSKKSSRSERLKKLGTKDRREKYRIETQAALRVQKLFRGYHCRRYVKRSLRKQFDGRMNDLIKVSNLLKGTGKTFYMPLPVLCELLRMCNVFYSVSNTGDFERMLKLGSFVVTSLSSNSSRYNYASLVHVSDTTAIDYSWVVRTYKFLSASVESLSYGLRLTTGVNKAHLNSAKGQGGIKASEWRNMQAVLNLVDIATSPQSWEFLKEIYAENAGSNIQNSQLRKGFGSAAELVLLHLVSTEGNIKEGDSGLLGLTLLMLKIAEGKNTNSDSGKDEEYSKALLFYQSKLAATILRAFQSPHRDIVSSSAVSNAFEQFTKRILMLPNLFMPVLDNNLKLITKVNNIVLRDLLIPVTQIPNAWRSCLHVLLRWHCSTFGMTLPHGVKCCHLYF